MLLVPLILSSLGASLLAQAQARAALSGPAAADRAFAARAVEVGVSAAFLEVLAGDGVLFRPGPVDGRAWMREHPDDGQLAWEPRVELVSAAGDLGVTLGPYTYGREGRTLSTGHFLSVWTRASSAAPWRLVADIGTPHAAPQQAPDYASLAGLPAAPGAGADAPIADAERALRDAESALARAATEFGAGALLDAGHARLSVLRPGAPPALGLEAAESLLERGSVEGPASVERVVVAGSADLAACWGSLAPREAGSPPGGWLRIWLRGPDGAWAVLADVRLAAG